MSCPSRPLAKDRLNKALEEILTGERIYPAGYALSDLRRKLSVISQERRFMLIMYLARETLPRTQYEIAEATRDLKTNVIRNLHVLVAEDVVVPARDATTGIVRYSINRDLLSALSELFQPGPCT